MLTDLQEIGIRSYTSEPDRGGRRWRGREAARDAVYSNRRRIKGDRGKRLLRRRGELIERSFAHLYETGAMRRTHLRGHQNILKRLLVHAAGFNLSLLMRRAFGIGKPKALQSASAAALSVLLRLLVPLHVVATMPPTAASTHAGPAMAPNAAKRPARCRHPNVLETLFFNGLLGLVLTFRLFRKTVFVSDE